MLSGILLGAFGQALVLTSNTHNFVDVPSGLLVGGNWAEKGELQFKVRFEHPAKEFVPSWTGYTEDGATVSIYLRPTWDSGKWKSLGEWSSGHGRTSVKGQDSTDARVLTDILQSTQATDRLEVRLVRKGGSGDKTYLDSLRIVATDGVKGGADGSPRALTPLALPKRAQMSYPGGNVLCSPTSVSMVLGYWADVLARPELDRDVPEVQKGVFDPGWGGTGNWPFNVAYAGSLPGMTGAVTRMRGLGDLESWLEAKVPVVCSVSYGLLKGQGAPQRTDGHLVVLVGFEANGDPVFNDPGRNVVRMTYKRADFEKAWSHSGRTVYLIYPSFWRIPDDGPWPLRQHSESQQ